MVNIIQRMRNIDNIILNILFYDTNNPYFEMYVVGRVIIVLGVMYDVVDRLVLVY